jgi:hypothetical protein
MVPERPHTQSAVSESPESLPHGGSSLRPGSAVDSRPERHETAIACCSSGRSPDAKPQGNGLDRWRNYYQLLQIKPYANTQTIRGAYRRLARQAHPDVNPAPEATEQMRAMNEAYTVLRDPGCRAAYDVARFRRVLLGADDGVSTAAPNLSERPGF